jgi:hypothetical protein
MSSRNAAASRAGARRQREESTARHSGESGSRRSGGMQRRRSAAAEGRRARQSAEASTRKVAASGAAVGAARRSTEGATRRSDGVEQRAPRMVLSARVVRTTVEKSVAAAARRPWRARVARRRWW